eukprot:TRINITY_DN784_c0_g1_i7.p1 TRINITY_DN784_c0_g1~~TRINITY_DN784_c0_g1_i7.p1  ORF type:complete len:243 (-),score=68.92 TRINITY_DN784_c0_g1_i7:53-781(-)
MMNQTKDMDVQSWVSRISTIQRANCTPDKMAQIRERSERQARAKKMSKKCNRIQVCSAVNQRAWNKASAQPESVERAQEENMMALSAMDSVQELMRVDSMEDDADEQELDDRLAAVANTVDLDGPVEAALEADLGEMEELLLQLRSEPTDEKQVQLKFGLFEKYMETVEKTRSQVLEFWSECKTDFHESGVQEVEKSLADMDGCLLYTSDAADEEDSVDLGGRRIIKKKKKKTYTEIHYCEK